MSFTVAIIGRPNVGKSTLYNRLTGTNHAIVDDAPGVTRDRRVGEGRIASLEFQVVDTAGLDKAAPDALESRMMQQTEQAVMVADVALLVVDGRAGITPIDQHFASWLRKKGKPIVLVVNKCEGKGGEEGFLSEAYRLGLGEPVGISAAHGEGMGDLYEALVKFDHISDKDIKLKVKGNVSSESEMEDKALQIAIVGRPNVGKSTLLNSLLEEERVLTGPEAGITRDAIAIDWDYDGQPIRLIDTAGMRRKANIDHKVEKLSVSDTLRSIQFAHVVVMLMDANATLEHQELAIIEHVIREGRAMVLAVNKWDTIEAQSASMDEIRHQVDQLLPQIKGVPVVTISALHKKNLDKLLDRCLEIYKVWNRTIPSHELKSWLLHAESKHPAPLASNKRPIRMKYMTQTKKRPPGFLLFVNKPEELPDSYVRYLVNKLRVDFDLPGIPIRITLRKPDNPYKGKKKKR